MKKRASWGKRLEQAFENYKRDRHYFKSAGTTAADYNRAHPSSRLSQEEIRGIDSYWARFGVRLKDYRWHQMYYDFTGIRDPRFLPQNFANSVIYPYYNDRKITAAWLDKNYFERFVPVLRFPETFGQKIDGRYYDTEHRCYLPEDCADFCRAVFSRLDPPETVVIKKTTDTNQGKGVKLHSVSSVQELEEVLALYRSWDNLIIQRAIRQHPFFAQFNSSSVNIVRITTWRKGTEIVAAAPCIRFGIEGSVTDITRVNGREIMNAIGVKEDGTVMDQSFTLYGERRPFTGTLNKVPFWEDIVSLAKEGHRRLEHFGVVAWDMTVDENDRIICLEYNLNIPGTVVYQMAHGPFWGEQTDDFLAFLRDGENQKRYIPRKIRLRGNKSER